MQDQYEKWLKVLGLTPGASVEAIRQAYRDLVKVWHPDRFGSDAPLREKAEQRLRELNDAFAHLQDYRPSDASRPEQSAPRSSGAPGRPQSRRLAISQRMAVTLIASAAVAAAAVWLVLIGVGHRLAGPERVELQPPPPVAIDRHQVPAPRPRTVAASRPKAQAESPSATTGSLRVESQPTGARVSFDGETIGETPVIVTDVAPGEHHIGLDLDARGYQRWSSSVVVSAGREEKLLAIMMPVGGRR